MVMIQLLHIDVQSYGPPTKHERASTGVRVGRMELDKGRRQNAMSTVSQKAATWLLISADVSKNHQVIL